VLANSNLNLGLPSDAELEAAMRQEQPPAYQRSSVFTQPAGYTQPAQTPYTHPTHTPPRAQTPPPERRQPIPTVRNNVEALSDRFMDRTIPQAVTLLLREEGGPLHVNEIYNRLLEGGFRFTGQNPTISVAVSLNRNTRFRKVAPGTFDLVMRDASKAS
jgi:hypothetical protein